MKTIVQCVMGVCACTLSGVSLATVHSPVSVRPSARGDSYYLTYSATTQPAVAQFGHVVSETVTFFMSQTGRSVTIQDVHQVGVQTATFHSDTCVNILVTSQISCEVNITYTTTDVGHNLVELFIDTDDGPAAFDVGVDAVAADLLYAPTSLSFGNQPLYTPITTTITVTNPNPADISFFYGTKPLSAPFRMGLSLEVLSCFTAFASSTCDVQVTYAPAELGTDTATFYAPLNLSTTNPFQYTYLEIPITGTGVQSALPVDLSKYYNVVSTVSASGAPVSAGGLDKLGNVYPIFANTAVTPYTPSGSYGYVWQREQFSLGTDGLPNAVANQTIAVPAGNYYGVSLLGTAVYGPLVNQPIVLKYMDGSTTTVNQSFSDWKTPKLYAGETTADNFPARLTSDGKTPHPGPYYLYGYEFPADHTRQLASITLPPTRYVIAVSMNLETTPRPVSVDISKLYNVYAIVHENVHVPLGGIDGFHGAISYEQISQTPQITGSIPYAVAPPGVLDAITSVTVPLPSGNYSTLRLLGMGVNGFQYQQSLLINYTDGTSTTVIQSFSDWHVGAPDTTNPAFANRVPGEANAISMPYRLNAAGEPHTGNYGGSAIGAYRLYEYDLPLDATKTVLSVALPNNRNVVVLAVAVAP